MNQCWSFFDKPPVNERSFSDGLHWLSSTVIFVWSCMVAKDFSWVSITLSCFDVCDMIGSLVILVSISVLLLNFCSKVSGLCELHSVFSNLPESWVCFCLSSAFLDHQN